jgi:invasion protein IalB
MQIKKLMALLAAAALALSAFSAAAAPTKGESKEKKDSKAAAKDAKAGDPNQFDNWRLNCQKPEGATQEICELIYGFFARAQGADGQPADPAAQPQMVLTLGIIKPVNSENPVLVMRAPLGAFLQPSPMIKVPGHKDVAVDFFTCNPQGCTTQPLGLEKEFVAAMRATEAAVAKDAKAPGATISIGAQQTTADKKIQRGYLPMNFELKGFSKGLDALLKKSTAASAPAKK